jgi:hypothetical protein
MRPKLIFVISLVAGLLLVNVEIGGAAGKTQISAAKPQTTAVKPTQPQTPVAQPETISPIPSTTPVDPFIFEAPEPEPMNNAVAPRAGEQINWQVLASGGGTQTLGTLVLSSTIGQTVAGPSNAGSYVLQSGFWQNFGGGSYLCGDPNRSGDVNISDVVFLVAYIFAYGIAPDPLASGDVDCDGMISIADCVYLVAYIFAYGAAPCAACS